MYPPVSPGFVSEVQRGLINREKTVSPRSSHQQRCRHAKVRRCSFPTTMTSSTLSLAQSNATQSAPSSRALMEGGPPFVG